MDNRNHLIMKTATDLVNAIDEELFAVRTVADYIDKVRDLDSQDAAVTLASCGNRINRAKESFFTRIRELIPKDQDTATTKPGQGATPENPDQDAK